MFLTVLVRQKQFCEELNQKKNTVEMNGSKFENEISFLFFTAIIEKLQTFNLKANDWFF